MLSKLFCYLLSIVTCLAWLTVTEWEACSEAGETWESRASASADRSATYIAPTKHRAGRTVVRRSQVWFPHWQTWCSGGFCLLWPLYQLYLCCVCSVV